MPNRMIVDRVEHGQLYYTYNTSRDDALTMKGSMVKLESTDVLRIPGLGFDGLVGYSLIAMAKNAIGMAIACEEYGAKVFANGDAASGVLEHPGTIKDPARLRESWASTFGGSSNAHKVVVLEEVMKYAYVIRTGLSHTKLAHLMDSETAVMFSRKAVNNALVNKVTVKMKKAKPVTEQAMNKEPEIKGHSVERILECLDIHLSHPHHVHHTP